MTARGRKPKTITSKQLSGQKKPSRLRTIIGAPAKGDMICPKAIADNPRAFPYWQMYLANVAPGHLSPVDSPLLARLCQSLAWADEASEKVNETAMVINTQKRGLLPNPYLTIARQWTEVARGLAAELALPPAERNRIAIIIPANDDPFADF